MLYLDFSVPAISFFVGPNLYINTRPCCTPFGRGTTCSPMITPERLHLQKTNSIYIIKFENDKFRLRLGLDCEFKTCLVQLVKLRTYFCHFHAGQSEIMTRFYLLSFFKTRRVKSVKLRTHIFNALSFDEITTATYFSIIHQRKCIKATANLTSTGEIM